MLLTGVNFANGVALDAEETSLLLAETARLRVLRSVGGAAPLPRAGCRRPSQARRVPVTSQRDSHEPQREAILRTQAASEKEIIHFLQSELQLRLVKLIFCAK